MSSQESSHSPTTREVFSELALLLLWVAMLTFFMLFLIESRSHEQTISILERRSSYVVQQTLVGEAFNLVCFTTPSEEASQ